MSGTTGNFKTTSQLNNEDRDAQGAGAILALNLRNIVTSMLNVVPSIVSASGTNQGTATVLLAESDIRNTP